MSKIKVIALRRFYTNRVKKIFSHTKILQIKKNGGGNHTAPPCEKLTNGYHRGISDKNDGDGTNDDRAEKNDDKP